ncbi:hypothetical protein [Aquisalimonas sp.]|uniref:hypothetical protein n=1 Tax=Aquisalimonas sp. TaxID=1872621 RepID=UPI0025C22402|nr:hypothetical protein [Aquisalimonas sp.]
MEELVTRDFSDYLVDRSSERRADGRPLQAATAVVEDPRSTSPIYRSSASAIP